MSDSQNTIPQVSPAPEAPSLHAAIETASDVPLTPPPPPGHTAVLQKLSSPPFPRSGFPLLGILASVYEHVAEVAARMRTPDNASGASPAEPDRAA